MLGPNVELAVGVTEDPAAEEPHSLADEDILGITVLLALRL